MLSTRDLEAASRLRTLSVGSEWRTAVEKAAALYGTPCYVTRARPICDALALLEHADCAVPLHAWLSVKTHPLSALLTWWVRSGRGIEVVSEAELVGALQCGCPIEQLLVNGVAKHTWLARYPIPGLRVHFDSTTELEALLPLALEHRWRVGIRLHAPDERDARDARFGGPFGMTALEAVASARRLRTAGAVFESVHFHLGQRPAAFEAWANGVAHAARVCREAEVTPRFLDCGGGLPAFTDAEHALVAWRSAMDAAARHFPQLEGVWVEHGRFLLEHASVLAVRVLDIKQRPECRYAICDGGRTNHALAADKGPHELLTVPARSAPLCLTTVCGPTCMTDDVLGRFLLPETVTAGDVLVWMNAGAYHLPWETRFSHGLCAVAWCDADDRMSLARPRQRPEERMAPWPP